MTEKETLAREVAGDNYGLSQESDRSHLNGRLHEMGRDAFDAGWDAAKKYYATETGNVQG